MDKIRRFRFTLPVIALVCFLCQNNLAQTCSEWTRRLGSENRIAFIDLDRLKSPVKRTRDGIYDFPASGLEKKSFYSNGEMNNEDCAGGSATRRSVEHYCLPFVALGYHQSTRNALDSAFVPVGNPDIDVFYEKSKNEFYFFIWGINFYNAIGPFTGNPRSEIPKVIKPRKERRAFPGVETAVVSKRWLYPNEADAKVPRDGRYDFVGDSLSGREIERLRLETFYTKIRLKNTSGKDLYYLNDSSSHSHLFSIEKDFLQLPAATPAGMLLEKTNGAEAFYLGNAPFKINPGYELVWKILPKNSQIEFEIEAIGRPPMQFGRQQTEFAYLMYLNDAPVFWDEVQIITVSFPSMYREFTDVSFKRQL